MGYINTAVEFRISMHRILIWNLLLRYKDEEDMFIYFSFDINPELHM